jgi:hypothetical protein
MSQKSSLPQLAKSVSMALIPDSLPVSMTVITEPWLMRDVRMS